LTAGTSGRSKPSTVWLIPAGTTLAVTVPVMLGRSTPASDPAKVRWISVPLKYVTVAVALLMGEMAVVMAA
jgi:hypothetical protein